MSGNQSAKKIKTEEILFHRLKKCFSLEKNVTLCLFQACTLAASLENEYQGEMVASSTLSSGPVIEELQDVIEDGPVDAEVILDDTVPPTQVGGLDMTRPTDWCHCAVHLIWSIFTDLMVRQWWYQGSHRQGKLIALMLAIRVYCYF